MNSVFNEHPSRRISDDFIEKAVADARAQFKVPVRSFLMLQSHVLKSLLQIANQKKYFKLM